MVDPNNKFIDPRTNVVNEDLASGEQKRAPAYVPTSNSSGTTKGADSGTQSNRKNGWFQGESGDELVKFLKRKINEYKPVDMEKLRKRQQAERVVSGISDAVMSVANLVGTHNYAPNMFNANEGMSAKSKERFARLKADREADDDRHYGYVMAYRRLLDAQEQKEYQRGRDAEKDLLARDKAQREQAIHDLNVLVEAGKIDKLAAEAALIRIKAEGLTAEQAAKLAKLAAETNASNASANASNARAGYYNRKDGGGSSDGGDGNGGRGGKYTLTPDTGRESYGSQSDYDRNVYGWADEYNIPITETQTTGPKHRQKTKVVKRPVAQIAADVEAEGKRRKSGYYVLSHGAPRSQSKPSTTKNPQGKKPNPMGSTQKKKNPMS